MPVAVFDIDGTLTDTMSVDVECYERAILEVVGIRIPPDWPAFDDVTDPSILAEACRRLGRPVPGAAVQARIADRVGELLNQALSATPGRFSPIPGATEVFSVLSRAGWAVAMATGAWRPSARVKLRGAGVPHEGVPLATASERATRREIIELAVSSVSAKEGSPVVYVGDGVWDGRAATALGFGFVGVGGEERAAALMAAGASGCLSDLTDHDRLISLLEGAAQ